MDSLNNESIIISDSEDDEPDNSLREEGRNTFLVYDDINILNKCHQTDECIPDAVLKDMTDDIILKENKVKGVSDAVVKEMTDDIIILEKSEANGVSDAVVKKDMTDDIIILEESEDDLEEKELWIDEGDNEEEEEESLMICSDEESEVINGGNSEKVICYPFDPEVIELDDEVEEIPVEDETHKETDPLAISGIPDSDNEVDEIPNDINKDKSSFDSSNDKNEMQMFSCPHCLVKAKTSHGFKKHLSMKHEYRPYNCTFCNYAGQSIVLLKLHLKNVHLKKGRRKLKCTMCNIETANVSAFVRHTILSHDDFSFFCSKCNFRATTYNDFIEHIDNKHPETKTDSTAKKLDRRKIALTCSRCKFVAKNLAALKSHFKRLHRTVALKCRYCDFSSAKFKELEAHVHSKHANEKPFVCPHCNYGTITFTKLKQHYSVCIKLKFLV